MDYDLEVDLVPYRALSALVFALGVAASPTSGAAHARLAVGEHRVHCEDRRVLRSARRLLDQYNRDVLAGTPPKIPLVVVLESLATLIAQPGDPKASYQSPDASERARAECEVLNNVNQEIIRITKTLARPS